MLGWVGLLVVNVSFILFKHLPPGFRIWPYHIVTSEDNIGFSASNLELGRFWVLFAATIDHATFHHVINNMAMLCLGGEELEELVGTFNIILFFFLTGAAGWLTTMCVTRYRYQGEMWDYAAKFQFSVGSSPATYGLATILATIAPDMCSCSALSMPPWVWISLLFFCPPLCSEKYNVQIWTISSQSKPSSTSTLNHSDIKNNNLLNVKRFSIYMIFACLISHYCFGRIFPKHSLSTCSITPVGVLFVYSLYTMLLKFSNCIIFGQPITFRGSDHSAHFGGSLAGAFIGAFFFTYSLPPVQVLGWLLWLLLRLVTDI